MNATALQHYFISLVESPGGCQHGKRVASGADTCFYCARPGQVTPFDTTQTRA